MKDLCNIVGKLGLFVAILGIMACSSEDVLKKFGSLEMQRYLIGNFDANENHKLSDQEAGFITTISLPRDVNSLKGISYLRNIENFNCNSYEGAVIDLSKNKCLRDFRCDFSDALQSIKLPKSIQSIYVCNGDMTELVLDDTPFLTQLYCYNNELQKIETGKCPYLTIINMSHNKVSEIDLSKYPNLIEIFCDNNLLRTLDVSNNPYIENIYCDDNENIEIICKKGQKIKHVSEGVKIHYID